MPNSKSTRCRPPTNSRTPRASYTEIRAPIAGVVSARPIKVGNTINPNEHVPGHGPRAADRLRARAGAGVPQAHAQPAGNDQVDALGGTSFIGHDRSASARRSIPQTGTFKATIEVDDPSERLKPGMFARIGIVYERREQRSADPAHRDRR